MSLEEELTPEEDALVKKVTEEQERAARGLAEVIESLTYEQLIEQLCVLQAISFRAGIRLAMDVHGVKEPS